MTQPGPTDAPDHAAAPANPNAPTQPQLQDAPPARPGEEAVVASDSGRPWVLAMAAAAMLIIGLVIGSLLWGQPKLTSEVQPFLHAASQGQYDTAYDMYTPEMRTSTTREEFTKQQKLLHKQLGQFKSVRQVDAYRETHNLFGELQVAIFDAEYENGDFTLTAFFKENQGKWQLVSIQYDPAGPRGSLEQRKQQQQQ